VARLPRLRRFYFDASLNHLNDERAIAQAKDRVRQEHGDERLEEKFERWKEATRVHIRLVDEYTDQIGELQKGYIQGLDFITMTGAVVLVERVLNRLVFAMLEHHKASPHYKKLYGRDRKLQNWDKLSEILVDWRVITLDQAKRVESLHRLRNDSVHYVPDYDFKAGAAQALAQTLDLIDSIYNVVHRPDLFWLFTVPGEIFARSAALQQPFGRLFVAPACFPFSVLTSFGDTEVPPDLALPLGPLSDEEFLRLRREARSGAPQERAKSPRTQTLELREGLTAEVRFV